VTLKRVRHRRESHHPKIVHRERQLASWHLLSTWHLLSDRNVNLVGPSLSRLRKNVARLADDTPEETLNKTSI
jgi:hypothetical protein